MYLSIDYGRKRIGLALGEVLPHGAGVVDAALPKDKIIDEIRKICLENEVKGIVIGLPFRSQGEAGTLADEINQFGTSLEQKLSMPVFYEPEQFTSSEAERLLKDKNFDRKSGKIDEMAAVLILEQFLANNK